MDADKFDDDGLIDVVSKFFGTLKNVYNFFVLYAGLDDVDAAALTVDYDKRPELDRWILSKYNQLVKDVTDYMDHYDHMKTVRAITEFVAEDLSNWYIRRARRRFYAEEMTEDKKAVLLTTYEMLRGRGLCSPHRSLRLSPTKCIQSSQERSPYISLSSLRRRKLSSIPIWKKRWNW